MTFAACLAAARGDEISLEELKPMTLCIDIKLLTHRHLLDAPISAG